MKRDHTAFAATLAFSLLGCMAVAIAARVVWLQTARWLPNLQNAERQRGRVESLPAARGTIVDRDGRLLAYDRPVVDVRVETKVTLGAGRHLEDRDAFVRKLSADLAYCLVADLDPDEAGPAQDAHRATLAGRIEERIGIDPSANARRRTVRVDILVARRVESADVIARLDALEGSRDHPHLYLHLLRDFVRTYPERELTYGVVGFIGEHVHEKHGPVRIYRGMESFVGLAPGEPGHGNLWVDTDKRRYWTGEIEPPESSVVLQTTLDLELQKTAHAELLRAVETVEAQERYGNTPPDWGALCLAEIESGAVLALASYRRGVKSNKVAAFAPTQCRCPPGSVVKPLIFSVALERGVLDWDRDEFDCNGPWYVPHTRRAIKDEHDCGRLTPRGILVASSNIGAVQVGLRLGRDGLQDYVDRFRFGTVTTNLPGEASGVVQSKIMTMGERYFWRDTAPSLSFGYEYNITPMQLLRAYVTLLSGRQRELRLYERVADRAGRRDVPASDADSPRIFSEATLARLRDAMRGVVSAEKNATARHLAEELERLGRPGLVAGKTGTSEFRARDENKGLVNVRTASFVGYAPADRPRFVAVCVLQKTGASSFWGGRYAAPSAGRLLVAAHGQEQRRTRHRGSARTSGRGEGYGFARATNFGGRQQLGGND